MRLFLRPKGGKMDDKIQTKTTGQLTPCLQKKIDKMAYLAEVHFSDTGTQRLEAQNMQKQRFFFGL